MRAAFVADVHVWNHGLCGGPTVAGVNRRCASIVESLRHAVNLAADERCASINVLGDLFERHNPSPQVSAAVRASLQATVRFHDPKRPYMGHVMYADVLVGNHDQVSVLPGDHACASLGDRTQVRVIDGGVGASTLVHSMSQDAIVDSGVYLIPSKPEHPKHWMKAQCERARKLKATAIGFHLGIMDGDVPSYLMSAQDAIHLDALIPLMKEYGLTHAFAGNWHWNKKWSKDGVTVTQCGPLVPNGWRDQGIDGVGRMVLWDQVTGSVESIEIPGARFLDVVFEDDGAKEDFDAILAAEALRTTKLYEIYLRVTHKPDHREDARDYGQSVLNNGVTQVLYREDRAALARATKRAATAAKRGDSLDKKLANYVNRLELPEGVDRDSVLNRLKGYIR